MRRSGGSRTLPASELDSTRFQFITRKLLRNPPNVPLDESAIGPNWVKLAPEVAQMFEWAHLFHRQVYDIWSDDRLSAAEKDQQVARVMRYYQSRRRPRVQLEAEEHEPDGGPGLLPGLSEAVSKVQRTDLVLSLAADDAVRSPPRVIVSRRAEGKRKRGGRSLLELHRQRPGEPAERDAAVGGNRAPIHGALSRRRRSFSTTCIRCTMSCRTFLRILQFPGPRNAGRFSMRRRATATRLLR